MAIRTQPINKWRTGSGGGTGASVRPISSGYRDLGGMSGGGGSSLINPYRPHISPPSPREASLDDLLRAIYGERGQLTRDQQAAIDRANRNAMGRLTDANVPGRNRHLSTDKPSALEILLGNSKKVLKGLEGAFNVGNALLAAPVYEYAQAAHDRGEYAGRHEDDLGEIGRNIWRDYKEAWSGKPRQNGVGASIDWGDAFSASSWKTSNKDRGWWNDPGDAREDINRLIRMGASETMNFKANPLMMLRFLPGSESKGVMPAISKTIQGTRGNAFAAEKAGKSVINAAIRNAAASGGIKVGEKAASVGVSASDDLLRAAFGRASAAKNATMGEIIAKTFGDDAARYTSKIADDILEMPYEQVMRNPKIAAQLNKQAIRGARDYSMSRLETPFGDINLPFGGRAAAERLGVKAHMPLNVKLPIGAQRNRIISSGSRLAGLVEDAAAHSMAANESAAKAAARNGYQMLVKRVMDEAGLDEKDARALLDITGVAKERAKKSLKRVVTLTPEASEAIKSVPRWSPRTSLVDDAAGFTMSEAERAAAAANPLTTRKALPPAPGYRAPGIDDITNTEDDFLRGMKPSDPYMKEIAQERAEQEARMRQFPDYRGQMLEQPQGRKMLSDAPEISEEEWKANVIRELERRTERPAPSALPKTEITPKGKRIAAGSHSTASSGERIRTALHKGEGKGQKTTYNIYRLDADDNVIAEIGSFKANGKNVASEQYDNLVKDYLRKVDNPFEGISNPLEGQAYSIPNRAVNGGHVFTVPRRLDDAASLGKDGLPFPGEEFKTIEKHYKDIGKTNKQGQKLYQEMSKTNGIVKPESKPMTLKQINKELRQQYLPPSKKYHFKPNTEYVEGGVTKKLASRGQLKGDNIPVSVANDGSATINLVKGKGGYHFEVFGKSKSGKAAGGRWIDVPSGGNAPRSYASKKSAMSNYNQNIQRALDNPNTPAKVKELITKATGYKEVGMKATGAARRGTNINAVEWFPRAVRKAGTRSSKTHLVVPDFGDLSNMVEAKLPIRYGAKQDGEIVRMVADVIPIQDGAGHKMGQLGFIIEDAGDGTAYVDDMLYIINPKDGSLRQIGKVKDPLNITPGEWKKTLQNVLDPSKETYIPPSEMPSGFRSHYLRKGTAADTRVYGPAVEHGYGLQELKNQKEVLARSAAADDALAVARRRKDLRQAGVSVKHDEQTFESLFAGQDKNYRGAVTLDDILGRNRPVVEPGHEMSRVNYDVLFDDGIRGINDIKPAYEVLSQYPSLEAVPESVRVMEESLLGTERFNELTKALYGGDQAMSVDDLVRGWQRTRPPADTPPLREPLARYERLRSEMARNKGFDYLYGDRAGDITAPFSPLRGPEKAGLYDSQWWRSGLREAREPDLTRPALPAIGDTFSQKALPPKPSKAPSSPLRDLISGQGGAVPMGGNARSNAELYLGQMAQEARKPIEKKVLIGVADDGAEYEIKRIATKTKGGRRVVKAAVYNAEGERVGTFKNMKTAMENFNHVSERVIPAEMGLKDTGMLTTDMEDFDRIVQELADSIGVDASAPEVREMASRLVKGEKSQMDALHDIEKAWGFESQYDPSYSRSYPMYNEQTWLDKLLGRKSASNQRAEALRPGWEVKQAAPKNQRGYSAIEDSYIQSGRTPFEKEAAYPRLTDSPTPRVIDIGKRSAERVAESETAIGRENFLETMGSLMGEPIQRKGGKWFTAAGEEIPDAALNRGSIVISKEGNRGYRFMNEAFADQVRQDFNSSPWGLPGGIVSQYSKNTLLPLMTSARPAMLATNVLTNAELMFRNGRLDADSLWKSRIIKDAIDTGKYVDDVMEIGGVQKRVGEWAKEFVDNSIHSHMDFDPYLAEQGLGQGGLYGVPGVGKYLRGMRHTNSKMEDIMRGGVYINSLKAGLPTGSAMAETNRVLYDYSMAGLTQAEQKVRGVVPFYNWSRRNIPASINQAIEKPLQTAYLYGRMPAEASDMTMTEYADRLQGAPDYIKSNSAPVFMKFGDKDYTVNPRLGQSEGLEMANAAYETLTGDPDSFRTNLNMLTRFLNPAYKMGGQVMTGVDPATGADVTDLKPGHPYQSALSSLIESVPFVGGVPRALRSQEMAAESDGVRGDEKALRTYGLSQIASQIPRPLDQQKWDRSNLFAEGAEGDAYHRDYEEAQGRDLPTTQSDYIDMVSVKAASTIQEAMATGDSEKLATAIAVQRDMNMARKLQGINPQQFQITPDRIQAWYNALYGDSPIEYRDKDTRYGSSYGDQVRGEYLTAYPKIGELLLDALRKER